MKKAMLIAEKPSLMRDIQNAYNHCKDKVAYDIDFFSQVGHLLELIDPVELNPIYKSWDIDLLPIRPENEGGWKYKIKKNTKDIYMDIQKAIKSGKYDVIIHAGDPDQEGELLVNLTLKKIGNTLPVLRLWSNDTTRSALENALQNLRDDSEPQFVNLYNAALDSLLEKTYGNTTYHIGDKVILLHNNYEYDYYNGDVGVISDIFDDHIEVILDDVFDEDTGRKKEVEIINSNLCDVALAYAITIHKSQGGEYDEVVIIVTNSSINMINRNLLYTAITRAKRKVTIITQNGLLEKAITTKAKERHSSLKNKICHVINK